MFKLSYHLKLTKQLPDYSVLETEDVVSLVDEGESNTCFTKHSDTAEFNKSLSPEEYQLLIHYYQGF